jgi:hypothetical protein
VLNQEQPGSLDEANQGIALAGAHTHAHVEMLAFLEYELEDRTRFSVLVAVLSGTSLGSTLIRLNYLEQT